MAKLVALVPDLIQILVGFLLEAVEEALFFQLVHAFLEQFPRIFITILAQAQLSFCLSDQLLVAQDLLCTERLF